MINEPIEDLNQRLIDHYGIETSSSMPIWRIVKASEQFEQRFDEYEDRTPSGLFIRRVRETREVPKYQHWRECYVLEQLLIVPIANLIDLPATKKSYEPAFFYKHEKTNKPLPPIWSVTKLVIDTVNFARGTANAFPKYKIDPQEREKELGEMMDYLYGDKSETADALAYREGVVVPRKQFGD